MLETANRMEEEGLSILKLNIGNPAAFGLQAPDEIIHDVILNLPKAHGYVDSKGLFSARKAVMQHCQQINIPEVEIDNIFLGNGVSELIQISVQALLNNGDELLIPAPDYPLWSACTSLSGGKPVHYLCDEENHWQPDLADLESKITERTRGIVVINPNNPTGAVYSLQVLQEIVEIARKYQLLLFADEIYEKIVFDDARYIPLASLAPDLTCLTFSGLSKNYRLAGFRVGWMILSGNLDRAKDYIDGLQILASMRLCSNVTGQYAVQTALGGYQSIEDLVAPGGRLHRQRELAWSKINEIPDVSCQKPMGATYLFPRIDRQVADDEKMVLDFLEECRILIVPGSAFNWPKHDHVRMVFLPTEDELAPAIDKFADFLSKHYPATQ